MFGKVIVIARGLLALATVCCAVVAQGEPVASFAMNEADWNGTAPQVLDNTGNGHDGTVMGGANTQYDAMYGQVGSFNGNSQYVRVGGSSPIGGARSIVAWIKVPAFDDAWGMPIITGGQGWGGDFFGVAGTGGENSNVPHYALYVDHWWWTAYRSDILVTPDQWTQVAMTYNGGSTVNFFVNGQAAGSVNSAGLYGYDISTYTIGGNAIGGNTTLDSFNGLMHNVRIYDTELSTSQMSDLYASEAAPEPSTLVLLGIAAVSLFAWRRRQAA
jgi:MSHA biogenesis protein MshQ